MSSSTLYGYTTGRNRDGALIKLRNNPKVESADWTETTYAVVLKPGWRDCGLTTGEHTVMHNTFVETMRAVRAAVECRCERRCKKIGD
jgi:hypothetical protein